MNEFKKYEISDSIIKSLDDLGYTKPFEIQEKVIPAMLQGKDILVQSKTGSGKTLAYAIPAIEKIEWLENDPQVLVLAPTRELAAQIQKDIASVGMYSRINCVTLVGRQPFKEQALKLKQKVHVVVGTPGRIFDHLENDSLKLYNIKQVIIDEADQMFSLGLIEQVKTILQRVYNKHQTCLFSATLPEKILELADLSLNNPINITIKQELIINENVDHYYVDCSEKRKQEKLLILLSNLDIESCIVFARTHQQTSDLADFLIDNGVSCDCIHGGMQQDERYSVMNEFKKGDFKILVATDVAARGIDVEGLSHVVNYDLPNEYENYVHRIGRCGRKDNKGMAISFVSEYDRERKEEIEDYIKQSISLYPYDLRKINNSGLKRLGIKPEEKLDKDYKLKENNLTVYIGCGKKHKIRTVNIVAALCEIDSIKAEDIGVITIFDNYSNVVILHHDESLIEELKDLNIKGKKRKVEIAKKIK